jgi:hypothetical protein
MCLAMSVTPPEAFWYYRHIRQLKGKVDQLSPWNLENFVLVLEACDLSTDEEFEVFKQHIQIEPFDYVAIIEWARNVLWAHEPWPGPF